MLLVLARIPASQSNPVMFRRSIFPSVYYSNILTQSIKTADHVACLSMRIDASAFILRRLRNHRSTDRPGSSCALVWRRLLLRSGITRSGGTGPTRSRAFCFTLHHREDPLLRLAHPQTSRKRTTAPRKNASLRRSHDMQYFHCSSMARIAEPNQQAANPGGSSMEERDFFDEKPEQRTHTMTCPHCGQPASTRSDGLSAARRRSFRATQTSAPRPLCQGAELYGAHRRPGGMQKHPLPQALRRRRNPVRRLPLISPPKQVGAGRWAPHISTLRCGPRDHNFANFCL